MGAESGGLVPRCERHVLELEPSLIEGVFKGVVQSVGDDGPVLVALWTVAAGHSVRFLTGRLSTPREGSGRAIACNRVAASRALSSAVSSNSCRREPRNASAAIAGFSIFTC